MRAFTFAITFCFIVLARGAPQEKELRRFPDGFLFGVATASYQIEGGWNADDKGENIWDYMTHSNPTAIKDQSNGDIAADSYHNYKRDVEMLRELGVDAYRFSLSWSRLLPTGFSNKVSEAGVEFYNNYINEMLKYNIKPMVTLYHWDLPQKLQDLGGWANPLIVDWFEDYARVVFENFGDRVKLWLTINEPREICHEGYGYTTKAPRVNSSGIGEYICAKNLVLAHAKAFHLYDEVFRSVQGGQCGITISSNWFEAASNSENDLIAAEIVRQSEWDIYAHPIFSKTGGFPKELKERIDNKSTVQGFSSSRLPEFTEDEARLTQGSSDFFGVNHYTANLVRANSDGEHIVPSQADDTGASLFQLEEWPKSTSSWLRLVPYSLHRALKHISEKYDYPTIYITENGWSTLTGLEDEGRITYYRAALNSLLDALDDGIKVKGYMAWSLMDNFEWMEGFTERFGLYEVNMSDPARTRTPRKAAFIYKEIVRSRMIDPEFEPTSMTMTIDDGH